MCFNFRFTKLGKSLISKKLKRLDMCSERRKKNAYY